MIKFTKPIPGKNGLLMKIEILPTPDDRELALATIRSALDKTEIPLVIVIANLQKEGRDNVQWKFNGQAIKTRRKQLGMTQAELANLLGFRRSGIVPIENGARDASPKVLCMLALVLRVDPGYFFEIVPSTFETHTSLQPSERQKNHKPKNRTKSTFLPGIKLRDILDEHGISQEAFAEKLSQNLGSVVSGGLVSIWIHGKKKPTQKQFAAIVEVLNIKHENLVGFQ
jgi:transcriptional regulator with XRE-family HTH domain